MSNQETTDETSELRVAGRRGTVRESHASSLRVHLFKNDAPFVAPPTSADVSGGIRDCGMLGNDVYGCCGPAAKAHLDMAKACLGLNDREQPTYQPDFVMPTAEIVEADYFGYGLAQGEVGPPNAPDKPDNGVDNASYLAYEFQQETVELFGELDLTEIPEGATVADVIHQAMIDFNGVLVAVQLNKDAETQFGNRVPWSIGPNDEPDPSMGHDIALIAYGPNGDEFDTWGRVQPATVAWDAACITDCWVFGTKDDAERAGYDSAAWASACQALINSEGNVPSTPDAPAVEPPAPTGLGQRLREFFDKELSRQALERDLKDVGTSTSENLILEELLRVLEHFE